MKQFRHYSYVVSAEGQVFRKGRHNPLKPDTGKAGYQRVTLSLDGQVERFLVHRVVAECYIPNPLNLPHINHIDNDPTNNAATNLEWCTSSSNMQHCHKQGRCANLVASAVAKEIADESRDQKFKTLLGTNFICSRSNGEGRSWVRYLCPCCKAPKESRSDSVVFLKRGLCRKCSKDEDIVSSYMKV